MSDRRRQQRAALIVGGAAVGGLAIIGLAIALTSGGDDSSSIDTSRTSTTSSSTTSSSSTSTSTTTTIITIPPSVPTTPPSIVFPSTLPPPTEPPTQPTNPPTQPTNPPTNPPTTQPPPSTTKPPTPAQQLATALGTDLNGGIAPGPGENRVSVDPLANNKPVVVTWKLVATLPPDEQAVQAREEALLLLQSIQNANPPGNDVMRLRATIPDPDGTGTKRVILLVIDRPAFDAFDFSTVDYRTVFELAFIDQDESDIDTSVIPDLPPDATTSSSTTTTDPDDD